MGQFPLSFRLCHAASDAAAASASAAADDDDDDVDIDAGVSRVSEQPAAAVSDAGRKVAVRMLRQRTRGSSPRPAGPTHAESSGSRQSQGGSGRTAQRDRVIQGSHRVPGEEVRLIVVYRY